MAEGMDVSVEPSGSEVEVPAQDSTDLAGSVGNASDPVVASVEIVTPGTKRKRSQEIRDPHAPKRPSTAYIFFSTEMRPKIREDYPELSLSERSKLMGKLWANLEQDKKQPYYDMAEQDKERYIRDYVAYQETDSYKEFMRKKYPGLSKRPRQDKPEDIVETPPTQSTRVYTGKRPLSCQQQYVPGSNIPIFSEKFLEHNREMEVQLRKLRQSNSSLEEECALLSRHVENMKTAVEKIQNEVDKQQTRNEVLRDNLGSLREVLASTFKDIAIPDTNETPTVDNIDSYMGKLQVAIASEPDKHPELVDKVTEIAKQLELYLMQRFSSQEAVSTQTTPTAPPTAAPPLRTRPIAPPIFPQDESTSPPTAIQATPIAPPTPEQTTPIAPPIPAQATSTSPLTADQTSPSASSAPVDPPEQITPIDLSVPEQTTPIDLPTPEQSTPIVPIPAQSDSTEEGSEQPPAVREKEEVSQDCEGVSGSGDGEGGSGDGVVVEDLPTVELEYQ